MDKTISVIVPVYGVEVYLPRCVDSILAQTYRDFELILVDDGGTDGCPAICDAYARLDERVKVIHKENGGLSDARNVGIQNASGKWISLIDSDDYVSPVFLEMLLQTAQSSGAEVAVCGFQRTRKSEIPATPKKDWKVRVYRSRTEIMANYFNRNRGRMVLAWNKLYRRECFDGITYPKGRNYEDEATTYRILYRCRRVAYNPSVLYYYFQRNDSITGQPLRVENMVFFEILEDVIRFYEAHGEKSWRQKTLFVYFKALCQWRNIAEAQATQEQGEERALSLATLNELNRLYAEQIKQYRMERYHPFLSAYKWIKGWLLRAKRIIFPLGKDTK